MYSAHCTHIYTNCSSFTLMPLPPSTHLEYWSSSQLIHVALMLKNCTACQCSLAGNRQVEPHTLVLMS